MAFPDPIRSIENLAGSAVQAGENAVNSVVGKATQRASDWLDTRAGGLGKALRAVNLFPDAMPRGVDFVDGNWNSNNNGDWRVRLSVPDSFKGSPLLAPLAETNGMVFPYTPNVQVSHSASYNALRPVHSNYPFQVYSGSQIDTITIDGEFTVENSLDGEYWIAAVHYLRSVSKMAYGNTSNQGSPPPVVKLNGYGNNVLNNIPVVVTQFNLTLTNDVDYIQVDIGASGTWVPTRSSIAVTLAPAYSRDSVNKFSLDGFVRGDYVIDNGSGFI